MGTTFEELVAELGKADLSYPLLDDEIGIRRVEARPEGFVEPTISVDGSLSGHQVLLISAPAAVGKTTVALAIAASTGAPLWSLSETQVGSNSFVGGVLRAFGADRYAQIIDGLTKANSLLVLDALDEAHLRAGVENLEAFIKDLAGAIKGSGLRPSVVLLARVETAAIVELMLQMYGLEPANARLEYFDEPAARRFLDTRLTNHWNRLDHALVHRQNPAAYRQAVDGVFAFMYECFGCTTEAPWSSQNVRSFLGYAPVLEAIADYLAVDNLQNVVGELAEARARSSVPDASSAGGPWAFLAQVIDRMVERERGKVIHSNLRVVLQQRSVDVGWSSWDELYMRDEQLDRVLRRFFQIELFSDRMPVIPMKLRDDYERALEPMADQHPFLTDARGFSNLVFQEFAFAWALTSGAASVRAAVRNALKAGRFLPSPLLGRFLLGSSPRDDRGLASIAPEDVGLLYDALAAAAARSGELLLWVVTTDVDGTIGEVSRDDGTEELAFSVSSGGAALAFWRRLSNADVAVQGGVALGLPGQAFVLGPNVTIETDLLDTPASEYVILGDPESFVRIDALAQVTASSDTQLKVYSDGVFEVSWEGMTHPWYPFAAEPWEQQPELEAPFEHLVSIIRMFRKHGRDTYARKKELIDNVVVGRRASDRSAEARRLADYMRAQGVLIDAGGLYHLDLSQLGMSWTDVTAHRMTPGSEAFLTAFVRRSQPN